MKRASPDSESSQSARGDNDSPSVVAESAAKRSRLVIFEPVRLPSVATVADIDLRTVHFQNRKLSERLVHKQRLEDSLRSRIEQLEKRQIQDDAMLCIINRHWNRLDEDVRLLLQRFDSETAVDAEVDGEATATTSFLAQLSQWDNGEIEQHLGRRVEFSRRAIGKLVQSFDRVGQRNQRISHLLHSVGKVAPDAGPLAGVTPETTDSPKSQSPTPSQALNQLSDELVRMNDELVKENTRSQTILTQLQQKNNALSLEHDGCDERLAAAETRAQELRRELDDQQYELEKSRRREDRLDFRLAEVARELQSCEVRLASAQQTPAADSSEACERSEQLAKVSQDTMDELQASLEEQRDLANTRLADLRELTDEHASALQQLERLKMDLSHIPADVIEQSTEYRCLQSQFSVLYKESTKIRQRLEDVHGQLHEMRNFHQKQIEQMESEELMAQKQLRQEMLHLEEQLSQVRREYEMLRLEFEQNLAANEQTGPINREMRQLLASYKTQNQQLKQECGRFKRKWKESISTVATLQRQLDLEKKSKEGAIVLQLCEAAEVMSPDTRDDDAPDEATLRRHLEKAKAQIAALRAQVEAATAPVEESRDRADGASSREKQLTAENCRLREEVLKLSIREEKEKVKHYAEDAMKRIRYLEEQTEKLKKESAFAKQEEDTLLNEMEVTGQAFEEMQEQNTRLLQQLKEKDDANLKLMHERIKSNQQQKKLCEEKDLVDERVGALLNQVEAQNLVVRKLEEKERLMQQNATTLDKEMSMRQQALELYKRKALEHAQSAADLKLQLDKLASQLSEAQQAVAGKTSALEQQGYKIRRLDEEISVCRKRLERAKKMEQVEKADEVLLEEIRELKEYLTCPSCKVRKKDAILTKCHHVFCMDCLKARYETRRRKCPKCNAAFGANDFRRIYIT